MCAILQRTFGGLTGRYYCRKPVSALLLTSIFNFVLAVNGGTPGLVLMAMSLMNSLLYPYARFAWERTAAWIANLLFADAILLRGSPRGFQPQATAPCISRCARYTRRSNSIWW